MPVPQYSKQLTACLIKIMVVFAIIGMPGSISAQPAPITLSSATTSVDIKGHVSFIIDQSAKLDDESILHTGINWSYKGEIPVMQVSNGNTWIKFSVDKKIDNQQFYLDIQYSNITSLSFYKLENNRLVKVAQQGNGYPFSWMNSASPNYIFGLNATQGQPQTYFLKVSSYHPLLLPAYIRSKPQLDRSENIQTIVIGLYMGIILAMFFYNLFLFVSTFDRSYLAYILFLMFLGFAQLTLTGNNFKFLWPAYPEFNRYALVVTSALAGIAGISFGVYFLHIKWYIPRIFYLLVVIIISYVISIIFSLAGFNYISYQMLNINGMVGGVLLITSSWHIARRGYKPAYFYLVAWISFLAGMVIFALRNFNLLPNNAFTTYILYFGSAIEAVLLSIALADKINTLRKEKEISQADALRISQENERLVKEQNVVLERKVSERTEELQLANEQLTAAFSSLKDAQIQLVEAEKMASLGQLTAGIAHEINNPINFVKSNIKPLLMDLKDLFMVIDEYGKLHENKTETLAGELLQIDQLRNEIDLDFIRQEVYSLMQGIEDGADRTAEIVRGLRNFSRLDESHYKSVNIHEGIESTLVILRNVIPENVKIVKDFKADGEIECYPGKLNQVFMNILSNSIQAIKSKAGAKGPENITITTTDVGEKEIEIRIKDSGPGMNAEVKQKIFDPFFTTKDVGEGTGLGLSIVFKIVQEHHGRIDVVSGEGEGAEFIITLHRTIPMKTPI